MELLTHIIMNTSGTIQFKSLRELKTSNIKHDSSSRFPNVLADKIQGPKMGNLDKWWKVKSGEFYKKIPGRFY